MKTATASYTGATNVESLDFLQKCPQFSTLRRPLIEIVVPVAVDTPFR